MFLQIIGASLIGSVFALAGGLILLWREELARRLSLALVSFAIGSLTGAAFLELIPEALHGSSYEAVAPWVLAGIFGIFLFEKLLHAYHYHGVDDGEPLAEHYRTKHAKAGTIVFGDALHNFIDGVAIALSFAAGTNVGIATTLAVFFHEVPQEIGDFGVLLHLGYEKRKVFLYNFAGALATPVGAIVGYLLLSSIEAYTPLLLAFAAGSFIYIAVSDLLPELHHHKARWNDLVHLAAIAAGVFAIVLVGTYFHE